MKKLLVCLFAMVISTSAYANDHRASASLTTFYKQFMKELSFYKFENMVTTLVNFSQHDHKPLNDSLSNINNIDATVGDQDKNQNWKMFIYDYSISKYNDNQNVYDIGYSRYNEMPIGGFIQNGDVNEDTIKLLIPAIKQSNSQYTSDSLLEISVSRDIRYGVYYGYLFAKSSTCYWLTYSMSAASVIHVSEVECPSTN